MEQSVMKGAGDMKGIDEERIVRLAVYILENNATVRCAAKAFSISKSTVHKDVSERLGFCDQFYFSRKFSEFHGFSPKRFRQMHNI